MSNTITTIEITATNECPHCGIETELISDSDAQALDEWLQDNYGQALEDIARGYCETRSGFTWEHGGNYAKTDKGLLGGDGDGARAHKASDVFEFAYDDSADKTDWACGYCSRYL